LCTQSPSSYGCPAWDKPGRGEKIEGKECAEANVKVKIHLSSFSRLSHIQNEDGAAAKRF
jgi:hypothetical protein